ncbi:hypothetical protein MMC13_000950 [Lambiella insularis]|nr:hypothetical protein [Lambiella insularis]
MSFGYAVGDVIAILNLFERVAIEVRNYRQAPQHFQQLAVELHLLQQTLHQLLRVEPSDDEEKEQLERIRAVALHCHQPLQAFINKMRPSERSLGPVQSAGTLSTIGRRLHWSLVTRNDVDDLRKVVLAELTAVNVLLGVQQLFAALIPLP